MELCKKDLDYVGRAEQDALKDVKKTPNMKLPLHFYSTFEKVIQTGQGCFEESTTVKLCCCPLADAACAPDLLGASQVKELLQANKPVRDAEWTAKEVCVHLVVEAEVSVRLPWHTVHRGASLLSIDEPERAHASTPCSYDPAILLNLQQTPTKTIHLPCSMCPSRWS